MLLAVCDPATDMCAVPDQHFKGSAWSSSKSEQTTGQHEPAPGFLDWVPRWKADSLWISRWYDVDPQKRRSWVSLFLVAPSHPLSFLAFKCLVVVSI